MADAQPPVAVLQDQRLRAQLLMFVPLVLLFVKSHWHLDLTGYADDIVTGLLLVVGVVGYVLALIKRIRDGKDPANPAPPIQTPAIVQTVQRLTR